MTMYSRQDVFGLADPSLSVVQSTLLNIMEKTHSFEKIEFNDKLELYIRITSLIPRASQVDRESIQKVLYYLSCRLLILSHGTLGPSAPDALVTLSYSILRTLNTTTTASPLSLLLSCLVLEECLCSVSGMDHIVQDILQQLIPYHDTSTDHLLGQCIMTTSRSSVPNWTIYYLLLILCIIIMLWFYLPQYQYEMILIFIPSSLFLFSKMKSNMLNVNIVKRVLDNIHQDVYEELKQATYPELEKAIETEEEVKEKVKEEEEVIVQKAVWGSPLGMTSIEEEPYCPKSTGQQHTTRSMHDTRPPPCPPGLETDAKQISKTIQTLQNLLGDDKKMSDDGVSLETQRWIDSNANFLNDIYE